jgi:hypothetical protein
MHPTVMFGSGWGSSVCGVSVALFGKAQAGLYIHLLACPCRVSPLFVLIK